MPTATLFASASLGAARSLASTRAAVRTSARRVAARNSRPGSIRGSRSRSSSILTMAASGDASAPDDAVEYFSPSKVNLFLRVVRRRDDGYHDLASLFHVIDLGDDMKFAKSTGSRDTLVCSDDTIPLDSSNLVIKALDLWRAKTGSTQMFWVELVKNVPHGAGLGGGSGNAATAMWAANELCGRPATEAQLLEWSGDIGSDISVFFSEGAAYCTGRGEIVEDVEPPIPLDTPMLLVKPNIGLSTPAIFKALDLDSRSTEDPLDLLNKITSQGKCEDAICVNDLEAPAFSKLPELQALKDKLRGAGTAGVSSVFMSGSGSTIVQVGSDVVPEFVREDEALFRSPARLITRKRGEWYKPSGLWKK